MKTQKIRPGRIAKQPKRLLDDRKTWNRIRGQAARKALEPIGRPSMGQIGKAARDQKGGKP